MDESDRALDKSEESKKSSSRFRRGVKAVLAANQFVRTADLSPDPAYENANEGPSSLVPLDPRNNNPPAQFNQWNGQQPYAPQQYSNGNHNNNIPPYNQNSAPQLAQPFAAQGYSGGYGQNQGYYNQMPIGQPGFIHQEQHPYGQQQYAQLPQQPWPTQQVYSDPQLYTQNQTYNNNAYLQSPPQVPPPQLHNTQNQNYNSNAYQQSPPSHHPPPLQNIPPQNAMSSPGSERSLPYSDTSNHDQQNQFFPPLTPTLTPSRTFNIPPNQYDPEPQFVSQGQRSHTIHAGERRCQIHPDQVLNV